MNLFELLKTTVSPSLLGTLANSMGETSAATHAALTGGAIPAVVAGLLQRFAGEPGASSLLALLQGGKHDGSLFNNIDGALSGGAQTDTLIALGKGLMTNWLGDRSDTVTDLIAQTATLRRSSAAKLLSLAAPLVLGALGKMAGGSAATAASVSDLLANCRNLLAQNAPAGLAGAMGLTSLDNLGAASTERKGAMYPWLLVPAAAFTLFLVLRSCSNEPAEPIPASQGQVLPTPKPAPAPAPAPQ